MVQITLEELKAFLQTDAFKLLPTQNKLCYPIIRRIYHKMKSGVQFENINVDKELLINGHHRYVCALMLKKSINTNLWSSPSTITAFKWSTIEVDEIDWESKELVDRHNQADALKSGLNIKDFEI